MTSYTHKKILLVLISVTLYSLMLLPLVSHAAEPGFVALAPGVEQSSKLSSLYSSGDLATYINRLFIFALTIGAILAVVRLMWGGYLYMGSGDMWSSKSKAKEVFGDVIFGILLLLAIYIILYQINPDMLKLDILSSIQKVDGVPCGPNGCAQN